MESYKSSRHHYIPKFLIKGFTNKDGFIFVYDKLKDQILPKARSPKSIFYESDRNTISYDSNEKTSLLEDYFFKELDNQSAITLKYLQSTLVVDMDLGDEIGASLDFFIINLYWRIPASDIAFNDLIERCVIKPESSTVDIEKYRDSDYFKKSQRIGLYKDTINQINSSQLNNKEVYTKISEFKDDVFLIGDNPTVFKSNLRRFSDFGLMDYLFAVSSKRLVSKTEEPFGKVTMRIADAYNVFVLNQSVRYVCSGDKSLLMRAVSKYKMIKHETVLVPFDKFVFDFNKKEETELLKFYKKYFN